MSEKTPVDIYKRMLDAAMSGKGVHLSYEDCITVLIGDEAVCCALEANSDRRVIRELNAGHTKMALRKT